MYRIQGKNEANRSVSQRKKNGEIEGVHGKNAATRGISKEVKLME